VFDFWGYLNTNEVIGKFLSFLLIDKN